MTQQFGFRASRNLAEVEDRDKCWDNLGIDRRDLALIVGTSAAGVTEGDYFNCKDLSSSLEVQISELSAGASSGLTAMLGKISKNGDTGIGTLSGSTVNNDRGYYNASFDIVSASTNSYFSPTTSAGYGAGAQYLLGSVSIPNLVVSGVNFKGETRDWSSYFVKSRQYFQFVDNSATQRFAPLYLAPPSALSSSVLWLDSEYSEITVEAGGVKRWEDVLKRGSAVQNESAYRPIVAASEINGKNGIYFDGSNDFLNVGSIGGSVPSAATLIVTISISNSLSTGDTNYSILSSLANISSAWRGGAWGLFTNALIGGFPAGMPANGTIVATVRASSSYGLEMRINGQRISYIAPPSYSYSSTGNFVIGVSDSASLSQAFNGSIHSLALFSEVLSDVQANSMEEYFRWRYGFVFDPDSAALSYTHLLHTERNAVWLLEDDSQLEVN